MKFNKVSFQLKPKRGFLIFLMCFVISLLSWITLKLSKTYAIQFQFNICYYHIPNEIEIEERSDSLVNVTIKDKGYNLLLNKYLYGDKNIFIDVSKLINIKEHFSIYPSSILADALRNQKSISSIDHIDLESVKLFYYHKSQKKVPVYSLMNWSTKKQYFVSDSIRILPDSVWVFGKKEDLSKINFVTTKNSTVTDLKYSYFGQYELFTKSSTNNSIRIAPSSAMIVVPVERYTESTIQCKIEDTYNDEYGLKTFPNNVGITFYVAVSKYKEIVDTNFSLRLDFSQNIGENRAPVIITKMPKNIKVVKVNPEIVEYLKVKK